MKTFIADKNRKLSKLALENISDLSYSALCKALRKKDVKVNGKRISADLTLEIGDKVEIYYTPTVTDKFKVLFCDDNVLVIYKKNGFSSESVYDAVKEKYNDARFIHRLDRNTDGIMIFALNAMAERELLFGFKERTFDKKYRAFVKGVPEKKNAEITAYLLKDADSATVKIYDNHVNGSVLIKTGYRLLEKKDGNSLLEVTLFTGKTHQIRAHLAYIGHPIIGDGKYGDFALNKKLGVTGQMLTAAELTLHFNNDSPLYYLNDKKFTITNK